MYCFYSTINVTPVYPVNTASTVYPAIPVDTVHPVDTVYTVHPVKSSPWEDSVITDMRHHTRHTLTQALREHTHKMHLAVDRESASIAHRVELELNSMLKLTTFEPSVVILDTLYNALHLKDKHTLAVLHAAVHQSTVWGEEMKRNVRLSVRVTLKKKKNPEIGYFVVTYQHEKVDEEESCNGMIVQLPKVRKYVMKCEGGKRLLDSTEHIYTSQQHEKYTAHIYLNWHLF